MPSQRARDPDLGALALVLAVATTGSVGAAARRFGISQSAASQRLRTLERDLDVTLLIRRTTGSVLTDAGRLVADWAQPLVQAAAEFQRTVGTLAVGRERELRVAASLTVADYLMPRWLVALHATLPEVSVSLRPGNSDRVVERVLAGEADLGFVEGPAAPSGVRSRIIGRDELVLVVAPRHPWARSSAPITADRLSESRLVVREPGSGTRQVLDLALAAHGLPVRPGLELGSTTAIKEAVIGGQDAAVLSRLSVADSLNSGVLREVPTTGLDLRREFRAVWRPSTPPAGPAGALLALSMHAPSR